MPSFAPHCASCATAWSGEVRIKECRPMAATQIVPKIELPVGVRGLTKPQIERALARYQQIVRGRNHERKPGAKLPRATDTRPYRFCVQDVVLAIWTMEHRKDEGDILVDVFLTSEVYEEGTRQG